MFNRKKLKIHLPGGVEINILQFDPSNARRGNGLGAARWSGIDEQHVLNGHSRNSYRPLGGFDRICPGSIIIQIMG